MARTQRARGDTRLSRERVLRAAVELADREGFESCTIRRLADELGVGAMSLYHYVPSKDDLVTGMVDVVFEEIELPAADVEWKDWMRRRAHSTREALRRHRWAVGLMESRAMPGPASFRVHDAILGCLRRAGFSVELTVQAYSVLDAYLYGFALQEKTVPFEDAEESAAVAAEQVRQFEAQQQRLADEFPYLAEVVAGHVAEVGYDPGAAFEWGLGVVLDALDRLRDEAGATGTATSPG